ncbi:MAG: ABC transporter substrate-binding protein, partial [Cyanobacteria bacterium J06631_9]
TDTDPSKVVCNGPYTNKKFVPGERIVFQANPYYWEEGPNGESQPYIQEVIWPVVNSQDAQFVRFRSGDADLMAVTPDNFALMKQDEAQGNYTVYNGGPTTTRLFMTFNLNKGSVDGKPVVDPVKSAWFTSVKFRQAVAYAIDRDAMLTNIFKGLGEMQNSQIAPQSPYFAATGLPEYDYNTEKARQLLLSDGFRYEGDQLVDAEGNQVRFTLQTNVGNKIRESAGAQIKQNLAQIGITVDFQPIDFNKLVTNISDSLKWDAIVLGFGAGVEPNSSANLWLTDGGLHFFNQQPQSDMVLTGREIYPWEQQISDLYVQAAQELDETKRKALYFETQKLVQENLPFIHLVGQYAMSAVRNKVENVKYTSLGGVLWNINALKIEE